jgi:hypothetical protein
MRAFLGFVLTWLGGLTGMEIGEPSLTCPVGLSDLLEVRSHSANTRLSVVFSKRASASSGQFDNGSFFSGPAAHVTCTKAVTSIPSTHD